MYVFLYALRGLYTACAFHQMASSWLPQVNELNYGYVQNFNFSLHCNFSIKTGFLMI